MTPSLIIPFPSRCIGSGTQTLLTGTTAIYAGTNSRQPRRQIIVTNVSIAGDLKIQDAKGVNLTTVFPRVALTIETSDDLIISNTSGGSIVYEVCEIFFDEGTQSSPTYAASDRAGVQSVWGGQNLALHGINPSGSGSGGRPTRMP